MTCYLKHVFLAVAGVAALAACGGCNRGGGAGTVPASGVVTLDGQPLADANVVFSPSGGGQAAAGKTDAQGKFQLTTFDPGDGAVPGTYQVAVTKIETSMGMPDVSGLSEEEATRKSMEAFYSSDAYKKQGSPQATLEEKHLVPQKYANPKDSGLTAEVKEGQQNTFKFDLQSEGQSEG